MTKIEARYIAQQHVSKMGEVLTGFKFGIGDVEEFAEMYYFDFIWLTLDGQPAEAPAVV